MEGRPRRAANRFGVARRAQRKGSRRTLPRLRAGWLAVVLLAFAVFLYYRPLQTYAETRAELRERAAEVAALRAERRALERRVAAGASEQALQRAARRLGLVRQGERLFIVDGIPQWRRAQQRRDAR